jgi:hypothetical protein
MKPLSQLINFRNYLYLAASLLCSCVTNLPPADALTIGMPTADALKAMRQQPRRVSAIGDLKVLHFLVGPHGALIGDPERFVIYTHQDHVIAFGHPSEFAAPPTLRYEHILSGGYTNKHIMDYNPPESPSTKPAPIKKKDNRA